MSSFKNNVISTPGFYVVVFFYKQVRGSMVSHSFHMPKQYKRFFGFKHDVPVTEQKSKTMA